MTIKKKSTGLIAILVVISIIISVSLYTSTLSVKELTEKILQSGKYPGTIAISKDKVLAFQDIGLKYILYLVDCEILRAGYSSLFRKWLYT